MPNRERRARRYGRAIRHGVAFHRRRGLRPEAQRGERQRYARGGNRRRCRIRPRYVLRLYIIIVVAPCALRQPLKQYRKHEREIRHRR